MSKTSPRVLVIFENGFEEIEALTPVDILRRVGAEVVTATVGASNAVKGRNGIVVLADTTLAQLPPAPETTFDALVIPGGPAVGALRKNPAVLALVKNFAAKTRLLGAICAAPLVLLDAGLLQGRRHTAFPSTRDELPDAQFDKRVVHDPDVDDAAAAAAQAPRSRIVTSRSAGTALDFALALVQALLGNEAWRRIQQEIAAVDET